MKNWGNLASLAGVLVLAIVLPTILKLSNSAIRLAAGAEGRLAAINVDTNYQQGQFDTVEVLTQNDEKWKTFLTFKTLPKLGSQRLQITGEGSWVRAVAAKNGETFQVLLVNFDPKGRHSEAVPVSFLGLPNTEECTLRISYLGGNDLTKDKTAEGGVVREEIPLSINSAVLLELTPKTP
jgi:hypothetical protein